MLYAFDFDETLGDSTSIYYKAVPVYSLQHNLKIFLPLEIDVVSAPEMLNKDIWGLTKQKVA